jgi:hypothetical protein
MSLSSMFQYATVAMLIAARSIAFSATIAGTVKDVSGKPLEDVRIDHTWRVVVQALRRNMNAPALEDD